MLKFGPEIGILVVVEHNIVNEMNRLENRFATHLFEIEGVLVS